MYDCGRKVTNWIVECISKSEMCERGIVAKFQGMLIRKMNEKMGDRGWNIGEGVRESVAFSTK